MYISHQISVGGKEHLLVIHILSLQLPLYHILEMLRLTVPVSDFSDLTVSAVIHSSHPVSRVYPWLCSSFSAPTL